MGAGVYIASRFADGVGTVVQTMEQVVMSAMKLGWLWLGFGLGLLVGCVVVDPLGTAERELRAVRGKGATMMVALPVEDCRVQVLAVAAAAGWEVFRQSSAGDLLVLTRIPGVTDTTRVGVFLTAAEGGSRVEIASPSWLAREKVARQLAERLE